MRYFGKSPRRMNTLVFNNDDGEESVLEVPFWTTKFHGVELSNEMTMEEFSSLAKKLYNQSSVFFQDAGTKDTCGNQLSCLGLDPNDKRKILERFRCIINMSFPRCKVHLSDYIGLIQHK